MTTRYHGRMKKLETPAKALPGVSVLEGPSDMGPDTALAMLKIARAPFKPVFYFGTLKPGERPRQIGCQSPITDAEWETLKNYPKYDCDPRPRSLGDTEPQDMGS